MYKHKAMTVLSKMIKGGEVEPDVDVREALKMFAEYKKVIKPKTVLKYRHRFYSRAATANARARKVGAMGIVTPEDLEFVYQRDKGKCVQCGIVSNLVFDHVVSYFRGGTNEVTNLQLLCRICNMLKGAN